MSVESKTHEKHENTQSRPVEQGEEIVIGKQ